MGVVMTKLVLWNGADVHNVADGLIKPEQVRTEEVDALVDTGATVLVLPIDLCLRLGLHKLKNTDVRLADGKLVEMTYMGSLWISICGREMTCDALAAPEGTTPLIGQIPLEGLDLILDPRSQEVRPNPAHPNGPIYYALRAA
jgi:clan AA aspartic protease